MAASIPVSPVIVRSAGHIGEYLSTWRRIEGITAKELAARTGTSVDTIGRIERGDPAVGIGKVLAVCRVLGILPGVEHAFDPTSTEYGRLQLMRSVPKRVRKP